MMWTKQAKRKLKKTAFFTLLLFVFQTAPPIQLWMPWTSAELYMHIAGKVTDADTGQPIAGLEIIAVKQNVPKAESGTATTTIDGNYDICCVSPGTYHVFANPQSNYVREQSPREITVVRGRNVVNSNIALKKGSMVIGTVHNADGTAFTNQAVVLAIQKSDTEQDIGYFVTAGDGRYAVRGLKPGQPYQVYVGKAGGQALIRQDIQAPAAGEALQNFQFTLGSPETKISGTVESNGVKIKNAEVRIISGNVVGYAKTDEQGHYAISGLLEGAYTLAVQVNGYNPFIKSAVQIQKGQESTGDASLVPASTTSGEAPPVPKTYHKQMGMNIFPLRASTAYAATEAFAGAATFPLKGPTCELTPVIDALIILGWVVVTALVYFKVLPH